MIEARWNEMTKVSVIIVNYNSSKLINDCLETIFSKTNGVGFEIIIVDNATEKLSEVIRYAGHPVVKLIELAENIGFGLANNRGAKVAVGDYLFFLNPDTLLINNAIKILSDFLDSHPDCGACGGNLYDVELRPTLSFRRTAPGIGFEINELFHLVPEKIRYGKNRQFNYSPLPLKVTHVSGADLMIRADLFDSLDGFSSDFFMYYEETDLCRRVYDAGSLVYAVPEAKIIHLEGGSFEASQNVRKIRMTEEGRLTYYRRNHSRFHSLIGDFIYGLFLKSGKLLARTPHKKTHYGLRHKHFKELRKRK